MIDLHFTGQGRDLEQLKAVLRHLKNEKKFMFVGCSKGDEIIDFQKESSRKGLSYFGIDHHPQTVELANKNKYLSHTKVVVANILEKDFLKDVKKKTGFSKFDVVVCRNLLIYYDELCAIEIIEKLAKMTKRFLVLGISDPFWFAVENNMIKIGERSFEVLDFDNKIFRKLEKTETDPMKRHDHFLAVDLGNKKLMRTCCSGCTADMFELKTKEPVCEECREIIRETD